MTDYPSSLDVRPLTTWPGVLTPANQRRRSEFSASRSSTMQALTRELNALSAKHPVLEVAIPEDQFRLDGRPRANSRETHPGVALSLPTTKVGPLRYATDTFDRWQDNLRAIAIALGLEALRKVDRYGITKRGEQYAGFKALPSGATPMPAATTMTIDEAARLLASFADPEGRIKHLHHALAVGRLIDATYRMAAKEHHPDRGGDRDNWDRLDQAKRVLDNHAGRAR